MEKLTQTGIDTAIQNGPWVTLSVAMVCAVIVFVAINLKSYLNRREANTYVPYMDLKVDINELRQSIRKLYDKQEKLWDAISEMKTEVAYIYGKLNGKPKKGGQNV